jgi:lauroyl/myristoyl acyltransferase
MPCIFRVNSWRFQCWHEGILGTMTFQELRRQITQMAIRSAIQATEALPIDRQGAAVRRLVLLGAHVAPLRRKVRQRMMLALGDQVPTGAESRFFKHVGWFLSNSLATFHGGIAATPVISQIKFDESIHVLDNAFAEKRGVVLTAAHWSGHELVAAVIARRHPMVMLVRQASTPERIARKLKWYQALGVETVLRPRQTSTIADAVAYLKVLKSGKMLAVTPDLLADPGTGVEVSIFGRPARLHGGAFAIAIAARAPMIRVSGKWQPDSSIVVKFERAPPPPNTDDRETAVRVCVQDWCRWFEETLRTNPENWLFWLDKSWSRLLRMPPGTASAE